MKKYLFLSFCLFLSMQLLAQAPFTTLAKVPNYVVKENNKYVLFDIEEAEKSRDTTETIEGIISNKNVEETEDKKEVGFFKNNSLTVSVLNTGENRLSVNSQVVNYNFHIFTPVEKRKKNYRYQLSLMIISKLSTSYDSINASSSVDVLDYEAAPVTLRVMPSFKLSSNKNYEEVMLFGFYADARGININNPTLNKNEIEVVGSGRIGFTFQGNGEAGFYSEEGEYEKGRWLISAMLQGAVGKQEVIQSLFNTKKDYVTSFQSYVAFKISDDSKFNLKVGYQHFFQESIAGNKNNFSIAIGL